LLKKLQRGDARWASEKEILGFLMDGAAKTVRISDTRSTDTVNEIRKILKKKGVQLKGYQRIVGKLCHVALILSGTKGLFSPIKSGLKGEPLVVGLRKSSKKRHYLI
jgi:RNase P subunit RPR2